VRNLLDLARPPATLEPIPSHKPNRSALGFLAVFGGLFVGLALVRGCRPRPADLTEGGAVPDQGRLAERRRILDARERDLAEAVATYGTWSDGRGNFGRGDPVSLEDPSRPVAILRRLPGVVRVEVAASPKSGPVRRRLIHLLDWHFVPRDAFAADVRAGGKPLSEDDINALYADHLLTVEDVQLHQEAALRCLARHGLQSVFVEGLTEQGLADFRGRVDAVRKPLRALADVRALIRRMEARGADADAERLSRARAAEAELVAFLSAQRLELLDLGAAARLLAEGDLEDVAPLDDAALLEAARPVAAGGKANLGGPEERAREDAMVRAALARGPFALVVLGGGHDLTESVLRVAGAECEYVSVTVGSYPE
jgi:hypothetical protein